LGVTLIGKVRRLALTLRRRGPFAASGRDLGEPQDAPVLEAVTAARPMFPGVLDDPPVAADRPFRSLHDLARPTAAIERMAAAEFADRCVAGLAPLEPVLVRLPAKRPLKRYRCDSRFDFAPADGVDSAH